MLLSSRQALKVRRTSMRTWLLGTVCFFFYASRMRSYKQAKTRRLLTRELVEEPASVDHRILFYEPLVSSIDS